jgi:hypothetical protein
VRVFLLVWLSYPFLYTFPQWGDEQTLCSRP